MRLSRMLLFIVIMSTGYASANGSVPWLYADFTPCHYNDEARKLGYCDQVTELVFEQLPQFELDRTLASIPRFYAMMEQEAFFCTVDLLWTKERAKKLVYSKPIYYVMPASVVLHKDNVRIRNLADKGVLDLDDLKSLDLFYGIRERRFYGDEVNDFLNALPDKKSVYASDSEQRLIDMLHGGRLDVIFLNPVELPLYNQEDQLMSIAIDDAKLVPTYMSCTQSPRGKRIVYAINQVLNKFSQERLAEPYLAMLPDEIQQYYRQQVSTVSQVLTTPE